MQRILEPEYMDTESEASEYDAMDHAAANDAVVARFLAIGGGSGRIIDLGTGPGDNPILIAKQRADAEILGIDAAQTMLDVAQRKVATAGLEQRIRFEQADVKALPYPDASFDGVVCSEVLEHIHDYRGVLAEIHRVLKPGGRFVASVPRAWPERLCWWLSDAYHEAPGGHIRIFDAADLRRAIEHQGFGFRSRHWAHALHVPYWWLRCLGDPDRPDDNPLARLWHRLLVWDLMEAPRLTRRLERLLNPVLGKSVVLYFERGGQRGGQRGAQRGAQRSGHGSSQGPAEQAAA